NQRISVLAGAGNTSLTFGNIAIVDPLSTSGIKAGTVALGGGANPHAYGAAGDADKITQVNVRARGIVTGNAAGNGNLPLGAHIDYSLGGDFFITGPSGGGTATISMG